MSSLKLQDKGFTLPELINSMFLASLLFVIFSIFYIYSYKNNQVLNLRFDAQNEASITMKRLVDEICLGNGYEIKNSSYLRVRRDINGTPSDFSDDTWEEFRRSGNQLIYTVVPPSGSSYDKTLSSSIDYFNVYSSSNSINIELRIKNGDYTFSLYETATPRSMALGGPTE